MTLLTAPITPEEEADEAAARDAQLAKQSEMHPGVDFGGKLVSELLPHELRRLDAHMEKHNRSIAERLHAERYGRGDV